MKQLISDKVWSDRIEIANRYYLEWDRLFKCGVLEKFYEGRQWPQMRQLNYDPYTINKVYESVQIKIANYVPTFPKYLVSSKPANFEYAVEKAIDSAQLKEDTLNSLINDPKVHFAEELEEAYKDSFFRFGIMEVGYAADWITNPSATQPLLKGATQENPTKRERSSVANEPKELPVNERIYFKHVKAKRFRVGGLDHKYLDRCNWVGYYDFVDKDQLYAIKNLMNKDKLDISQTVYQQPDIWDKDEKSKQSSNAVKIWHIWDSLARVRLLLLDSPRCTLFQRKFDRLPLFDLRPDKRLLNDGFYPVPPVFHWLSAQNEINETREMLRAHRRRFVRKFQVVDSSVDEDEIEKFETGPDGALIKVHKENAITPIDNADLGTAESMAIQTAEQDMDSITGLNQELQGSPDRETATAAQIANAKSGIRGNKERDRFVIWLATFGREALLLAKEKFALGVWVKIQSPEGENFLGSIQDQGPKYKWVTSEDLEDGYDFRIDVDVTSLSQTEMDTEKTNFVQFLTIINQFPQIALSPTLVRESAYRCGYRNDKVIKELQKMALLHQLGLMNQLQSQVAATQQQAGGTTPGQPTGQGGGQPQQLLQQMMPPNMEAIRNQMANQLSGGQQ
jgi:hypothetical protein